MLIGPYVDSSAAHGPTHRFAAAGILLACLIGLLACANPAAHSPKTSNGTSSLSVSIAPQASRAIVAGSTDYFGAIKAYKVTVSDTNNSYTSTTVSAGICTIEGIAVAADYAVAVQAYSDTGSTTQIASGSASSVVVTAGATTTVPITLSFTQTKASGGYSLKVAWPASTVLPYVCARLDSTTAAYTAVQGTSDGTNYTATISASNLSGGAHQLYIYFAATSSSSTLFGPYLELLDIWDGVTDSMWADPNGALHDTLSLAPAEFASSDATLAGLSVASLGLNTSFAPTTFAYNFGGSLTVSTSYPFTITTQSPSQGVSCSFNGADSPLTATSSTTLTGSFTAVSGTNTITVSVIAADRKTLRSYAITSSTLVASAADLASMATNLSGSYVLAADIDTTVAGNWTPIGTNATPFTGTFDGCGHTVTLTINTSVYGTGLFGVIGAGGMVENVHVACTISAGDFTGAIAGINKGTIENCCASGTITGTIDPVGGLVGQNGIFANGGTIIDCYSTANVSGSSDVGGLVGAQGEMSGYGGVRSYIINCYARGTVDASSSGDAGGLVGDQRLYGDITDSYATGKVTGPSSSSGGLVAIQTTGAVLTNCYYDTATTGQSDTGKGTGLDTASMQSSASFALWDFASTWNIDATKTINGGYPYLISNAP